MTPMLAQAYAARAAIDALILQMEIAEGVPAQGTVAEAGGCPQCGAPEDKQVTASAMGGSKTVMCTVCKSVRTL